MFSVLFDKRISEGGSLHFADLRVRISELTVKMSQQQNGPTVPCRYRSTRIALKPRTHFFYRYFTMSVFDQFIPNAPTLERPMRDSAMRTWPRPPPFDGTRPHLWWQRAQQYWCAKMDAARPARLRLRRAAWCPSGSHAPSHPPRYAAGTGSGYQDVYGEYLVLAG